MKRAGIYCLMLAGLAGCHRHKATAGPKVDAAAPLPPGSPPRVVDSLYTMGERLFRHGSWGEAAVVFDRVSPSIPLGDRRLLYIRFFQGEIKWAEGDELGAVKEFRRVADEAPTDSLAPDALARAADAYAALWRDPELDPTYGQTALLLYQDLASRYPTSPAAKRAQLRVKELQERFAFKEYRSALFYFKFKAYDSAILLFRSLIATYPKSAVVPDALLTMLKSFRVLGYQEDIKETCRYLRQYHPSTVGADRLCPKESGGAP